MSCCPHPRSRSKVTGLALMTALAWSALASPRLADAADKTAAEKAAAEKTAVDLLPATTHFYAEVSRPKELLSTILEHPLRQPIEALPPYQEALKRPEYLQFMAVLAVVEAQLGMRWREAVETLVDGGIHVAADSATKGNVLLLRGRDPESVEKLLGSLLNLARDDAKRKGQGDPIKTAEYRGIRAYELDKAKMARVDRWLIVTERWLIVTENGELGKRILDTLLDGGDKTLAHEPQFVAAQKSANGRGTTGKGATGQQAPTAWAFVNLATLRASGEAKDLFKGRTDNPVAELLAGAIAGNLQHAPYATASLTVEQRVARLTLAMPHEPAWTGLEREYFLGAAGGGKAPPLPVVKDTLLAISAYRDISQMWLRAGDLFDEKTNDELDKADSNLSTLFGGKRFGEDILGSFRPAMQLIVSRQTYEDGQPSPAIKLPAFAFVFQLKDKEKMQPELRRIFQSLIGFLNIVGAMNGQPQLDLDIEKSDGRQLITGTYLPEEAEKKSRSAKINFNFSPSIAFVDERCVISSTRGLARELSSQQPAAAAVESNTRAASYGAAVRQILDDNREQIVAQTMLQEGKSKDEAEKQVEVLLRLVALVREAGLRLDNIDKSLRLQLELSFSETR